MKRILILSFSTIKRDPRVNRQISFLKDESDVTVCGWGEYSKAGVKFIQADDYRPGFFGKAYCMTMLGLHLDRAFYWGMKRHRETYRRLRELEFDIIVANDVDTLAIALKLAEKNNAKIIADLHEYFPGQSSDLIFDLFFKGYNMRMCKKFLPEFNKCMTVSDKIAELYTDDIGIKMEALTNATDYEGNLKPGKVDPRCIKLIHHGVANPDRKILELIEVLEGLEDRFVLTLVLVEADKEYMEKIKSAVQKSDRIELIPPYPMKDIAKNVNKYDLGICMLEPKALSKKLALPNKFFEWVQGRLGIISWPLPGMADLILENDIGVVSDEFDVSSMQTVINELQADDINRFKQNSCKVAEQMNAQANRDIFRKLVLEN